MRRCRRSRRPSAPNGDDGGEPGESDPGRGVVRKRFGRDAGKPLTALGHCKNDAELPATGSAAAYSDMKLN